MPWRFPLDTLVLQHGGNTQERKHDMRHTTRGNARRDVRVNGTVRQLLRDVQQRCGYGSEEGRRAQKILASRQTAMPERQLKAFIRMLEA